MKWRRFILPCFHSSSFSPFSTLNRAILGFAAHGQHTSRDFRNGIPCLSPSNEASSALLSSRDGSRGTVNFLADMSYMLQMRPFIGRVTTKRKHNSLCVCAWLDLKDSSSLIKSSVSWPRGARERVSNRVSVKHHRVNSRASLTFSTSASHDESRSCNSAPTRSIE